MSKLEQDIELLKKQNKLMDRRIKILEKENHLLKNQYYCPIYERRSIALIKYHRGLQKEINKL